MIRASKTGDMYRIYLNGRFVDFFQADTNDSDFYTTRQGIHDAHWDAITAVSAIRDAFQAIGIHVDIQRTWVFKEDSGDDYDAMDYNIITIEEN